MNAWPKNSMTAPSELPSTHPAIVRLPNPKVKCLQRPFFVQWEWYLLELAHTDLERTSKLHDKQVVWILFHQCIPQFPPWSHGWQKRSSQVAWKLRPGRIVKLLQDRTMRILLVSLGCHNNVPQAGWHEATEMYSLSILSKLWKLDVWTQGVSNFTFPLKALEKSPFLPFLALDGCQKFLVFQFLPWFSHDVLLHLFLYPNFPLLCILKIPVTLLETTLIC